MDELAEKLGGAVAVVKLDALDGAIGEVIRQLQEVQSITDTVRRLALMSYIHTYIQMALQAEKPDNVSKRCVPPARFCRSLSTGRFRSPFVYGVLPHRLAHDAARAELKPMVRWLIALTQARHTSRVFPLRNAVASEPYRQPGDLIRLSLIPSVNTGGHGAQFEVYRDVCPLPQGRLGEFGTDRIDPDAAPGVFQRCCLGETVPACNAAT